MDRTLDDLYSKLGIHKLLPPSEFYRLAAHSVDKANALITAHLRIKNPVIIKFVSETFTIGFGKTQSIPGRILFPGNFKWLDLQTPVTIEIAWKYKTDFHSLGAILAHENTHLILKQFFSEDDEMYTDLAAMVLGLGELMSKGRSISKTAYTGYGTSIITSTIGYLDGASFNYAYYKTKKICTDCEKLRLAIQEIGKRNKASIKSLESMYRTASLNMQELGRQSKTLKVKQEDGKKLVNINNHIFQNELPATLQTEKNTTESVVRKCQIQGGFIASHKSNLVELRDKLDKQAGSLRSLKQMLQGWLELQDRYLKPCLWRRLFR